MHVQTLAIAFKYAYAFDFVHSLREMEINHVSENDCETVGKSLRRAKHVQMIGLIAEAQLPWRYLDR